MIERSDMLNNQAITLASEGNFKEAIANLIPDTFLAPFGQRLTHLIQEIHFSLSVSLGLSKGIAPTGQFSAHIQHLIH